VHAPQRTLPSIERDIALRQPRIETLLLKLSLAPTATKETPLVRMRLDRYFKRARDPKLREVHDFGFL
jgi:hypothetical protein